MKIVVFLLVTKKDFIFNERQSFGNKARALGICRVNILNGYVEKHTTGFDVSKPITIGNLVGTLKTNNKLGPFNQDDKIEGSLIL